MKWLEHIGERPASAGRSLFTAFPPSCMKQKDEIRRSSSWETASGRMENRGTAHWPAALPVHVERLAKALGLEVVVEERLQPTVKGYIQGNAIHLPPSTPDAAMEILRHELTHRMQELSPRQYGKYRDYVIRQDTAADAAAKYEAYRRAGHPLTPEQVVDELVADYAGRHLREEGAIRRLAGENRTLAEWVRGTIRALAERIREKLGRAEPTLEHAQRLWERAFRAAEQHASLQNPSVPLPRPESPARYSIREEIDSSHSEEYTVENAGMGGIGSRENVLPKESSHDSARNTLMQVLDETGAVKNGSNPYTGRLKSSYGYEKQIGRTSLDGKVRWRLDYDPEMGVHYNIEDFTSGKGVNAKKTVIPIDISYDEYKAIIDLWN